MSIGRREAFSSANSSPLDHRGSAFSRRRKRTAIIAFGVLLAVVIVLIVGHQLAYAGRIYPGVAVGDLDVGAMNPAEARAALDAHFVGLDGNTLTLTYNEREFQQPFSALGVKLDTEASIQTAMNVGRQGNLLQALSEQLGALVQRHQTAPVLAFDEAALSAFVESVAQAIDQPAVSASLVFDGTNVEIGPSTAGLMVNRAETANQVRQALFNGPLNRVAVVAEVAPPEVVEEDLIEACGMAEIITSAPLELAYEGKTWALTPQELAAMVQVHKVDEAGASRLVAAFDETALTTRLTRITNEVDIAPIDAQVVAEQGEFTISPSEEGQAVDMARLLADVSSAAIDDNRRVSLKVDVARPQVFEADLVAPAAMANRLVSGPVTLQFEEREWTLSSEELIPTIKFAAGSGSSQIKPFVDEQSLESSLADIIEEVNRPPENAVVEEKDGIKRLVSGSTDGLQVNVADTAAAILTLATSDERTVDLCVDVERPEVRVVADDLLVTASTSYAGSIAERAHNVRLATARLDGIIIEPGKEFSFNDSLGPVTIGSGYKVGYGITISNGEMVTVPSEGGGICQVATTMFHAAFNAGLEIVERYPHYYWIPRYGQPPLAMKGLDATVDTGGPDLRVRNNTGNTVLLRTIVGSSDIYFSLYGTDPGWDIKIEGPFISNIVPADPNPVRQEDPSMAEGRELWVEHAEDGFDVQVLRTVSKDGKEVDKISVFSRYRPSRNVLLVSKPKETPTPGPEGTPGAEGTPGPDGTPVPGDQPSPTATVTPQSSP